MKYPDDTKIALIVLMVICIAAIIAKVDGVKDIALTVGGGIVGWLSKGRSDSAESSATILPGSGKIYGPGGIEPEALKNIPPALSDK